jgi:hypothetical protein
MYQVRRRQAEDIAAFQASTFYSGSNGVAAGRRQDGPSVDEVAAARRAKLSTQIGQSHKVIPSYLASLQTAEKDEEILFPAGQFPLLEAFAMVVMKYLCKPLASELMIWMDGMARGRPNPLHKDVSMQETPDEFMGRISKTDKFLRKYGQGQFLQVYGQKDMMAVFIDGIGNEYLRLVQDTLRKVGVQSMPMAEQLAEVMQAVTAQYEYETSIQGMMAKKRQASEGIMQEGVERWSSPHPRNDRPRQDAEGVRQGSAERWSSPYPRSDTRREYRSGSADRAQETRYNTPGKARQSQGKGRYS